MRHIKTKAGVYSLKRHSVFSFLHKIAHVSLCTYVCVPYWSFYILECVRAVSYRVTGTTYNTVGTVTHISVWPSSQKKADLFFLPSHLCVHVSFVFHATIPGSWSSEFNQDVNNK